MIDTSDWHIFHADSIVHARGETSLARITTTKDI